MLVQNHFTLSQPIFITTGNDSNTIKMTLTMQENYSELSKFMGEMTIIIRDIGNPEITINNDSEYKNALAHLLRNHNKDHGCEGK